MRAMAGPSDEIARSIERTLREEARKNELSIGYVRSFALLLATVVNLAAYIDPPELDVEPVPASNFVLTGLCTLAAVWLLAALRRGLYRDWFRLALPFADALMVLALFGATTRRFEPEYLRSSGVLVNMASLCGLLAVSGGLRLTRPSALLSTGLSVMVFVYVCSLAKIGVIRTAFPASFLIGGGVLSSVMTGVVQRAVKSEVARSILERLLPPRVIADAHSDPLALVLEPRLLDATVVVTDLRGFTAISERMSPREVLDFLNEVQGMLSAIVHDHGGTIDKFMGDGMLAVFGAPDPLPDHATRALRATKALVDAMAELAVDRMPGVKVGVGIHSGQLIAGCLGSGSKLEFTVLGDTVNAASRLESLTKEHGVSALISEETVRRARDVPGARLPALRRVGQVTLRGRTEPIEVHTLQEDRQSLASLPSPPR